MDAQQIGCFFLLSVHFPDHLAKSWFESVVLDVCLPHSSGWVNDWLVCRFLINLMITWLICRKGCGCILINIFFSRCSRNGGGVCWCCRRYRRSPETIARLASLCLWRACERRYVALVRAINSSQSVVPWGQSDLTTWSILRATVVSFSVAWRISAKFKLINWLISFTNCKGQKAHLHDETSHSQTGQRGTIGSLPTSGYVPEG